MTRATLLAPPYQVQDGRWRAFARLDGKPTRGLTGAVTITVPPEGEHFLPGKVVNVTREGDEWRAV
jgi:hypothetical protein